MKEWKEYLNRDITCTCGKTHRCDIEEIIIEEGALLQMLFDIQINENLADRIVEEFSCRD